MNESEMKEGREDREAARRLLSDALLRGEPLRFEVEWKFNELLTALVLSEQPEWSDEAGDQACQAAGWRVLVRWYRELLAEVRENGVSR